MQVLPSLLSGLKAVCATFPDTRKGRGGNIDIADFGLSAFAMFFMQGVSFLAFQRALEKGQGRSNAQTLFEIGRIPSDNYIRDMLDEADPVLLQPCFERMETLLAEPTLRQAFGRLGGRTLVAWDGTEYFCSQKLGCPNCLTRKRSNGKTENYHSLLSATVVAPGHSKVVPLMPEFVATQDGAEKQDCVATTPSNAGSTSMARGSPRCARSFWATICSPVTPSPRWSRTPATISSSPASRPRTRRSTTSSTAPSFRATRRKCAAAPRKRPSVIAGSRPFRSATARTPCSSTGSASRSSTPRASVKYSMAWVTSLPVSKDNVAEIVACGRARWKIENESFNVMKNHGYELEHNFGHGQKSLAMMLAAFNLLAFAWHTVLELLEPPWQAAREAAAKRTSFFAHILMLTAYVVFPSWRVLLEALTNFTIPPDLVKIRDGP